jgi:hypothetical protein
MAQFNAIKLNLDEGTFYGISNKANTYKPDLGTFPTRRLALIKAHECNVSYFDDKSRESFIEMLALMEKEDDYVVGAESFKDLGKGYDFYTYRSDLLC